jgi:hypothetical protein
VLLHQQYRKRGFNKYSKLISCLFVVEKNNKLLMKNYVSQLISSALFPEVNAIRYNNNYGHVRGYGRGCGRGHGRRWNNFQNNNGYNSNKPFQNKEKQEKRKNIHSGDTKKIENI